MKKNQKEKKGRKNNYSKIKETIKGAECLIL